LSVSSEGSPKISPFGRSTQESLIGAKDITGSGVVLFQEFNPEATEPRGAKLIEVSSSSLGDGIEEGIPATDIGT